MIAIAALAVCAVALPSVASADPPPSCASSPIEGFSWGSWWDSTGATAGEGIEMIRLEGAMCRAIAARLDLVNARLALLCPDGTPEVGATNCVASLSTNDANRSELAWWGTWFTAGLILVLLIGSQFTRGFKLFR